jgi:hypothetical protein
MAEGRGTVDRVMGLMIEIVWRRSRAPDLS